MVATRRQIETIADDYVRNLQKRGIRVQQVILFGSYARGEAADDSDIDMAFISDDFEKYNILERQKILAACRNGFAPTEVLGYSKAGLEAKASRSSLAAAILREGELIYANPS
jgi:hypothetical protein